MANRIGRTNSPEPERIESWNWQPPFAELPEPGTVQDVDEVRPQITKFDLATHWRRGGYLGSLNADTDQRSREFLDELISNGLFVLPARTRRGIEIDHDAFLRLLARHNGRQLDTLCRKTGWDDQTFQAVIDSLVDRDMIFRLPFEPLISGRSDLSTFVTQGAYIACSTRDGSKQHRRAEDISPEVGRGWQSKP